MLLTACGAGLLLAGSAAAHHTASNGQVQAHHTASGARVEAHHTASDARAVGTAVEEAGLEGAAGPKGGALVALGNSSVLEFTQDEGTGMIHMWVWEPDLETPRPIRQEMVIVRTTAPGINGFVMLVPQEDGTEGVLEGETAHYAGGLDPLADVSGFDAVIEGVSVDGESFRLVEFPFPAGRALDDPWPAMSAEEIKARASR
jgi:hypothetical protein